MEFGEKRPSVFLCRTWSGCVMNMLNLFVSYRLQRLKNVVCANCLELLVLYVLGILGEGVEPR